MKKVSFGSFSVSPILLGSAAIVVIVGIALLAYQSTRPSTTITPTPTPTASASATTSPTPTPTATATSTTLIKDANITWLTEPKKLGNLALFQNPEDPKATVDVEYYQVGTYKTQDLVMAQVLQEGPGEYRDGILFLANKSKPGYYHILTGYNRDIAQNYFETTDSKGKAATWITAKGRDDSLASDLPLDFNSVKTPTSLLIGDIQLDSSWSTYSLFSSLTQATDTVTAFKQTAYGTVYKVVSSLDDGTLLRRFVLKRQDSTGQQYTTLSLDAVIGDDGVASVTWADGTKNTSTFRGDGGGSCGSPTGLNIAANASLSDWKQTGTAAGGVVIYEPKDSDNTIIKKWYELSNGTYYDSNGNSHSITYAEFIAKHPILAYKDIVGDLAILRNTTYGVNAECGKPVVYLYPEKTTPVSVQVGAIFHHTIPAYTTPWQVVAQPNGQLRTADGRTYPYLYWSGQGKGHYPVIMSGTIVAREQVQTTLREQLVTLGLNAQEQADFLEFWAPRMPTTPYTRLTWFGNKEMDELAPMTITPKPDVTIRLFLDFEGLQQPIALKPQKLSATPRHGFTAVEWGGLLRTPEISH